MPKSRKRYRRLPQAVLDEIFTQATEADESKKYKKAFPLFLVAARGGESGCQVNLGNYYSEGRGVRRDYVEALYLYKRALRSGNTCAVNNIGIVYRDQGKTTRALAWFHKAVARGDADANLNIAKLHLRHQPRQAIPYLRAVIRAKAKHVTEHGREEAVQLLKFATKKTKKAR